MCTFMQNSAILALSWCPGAVVTLWWVTMNLIQGASWWEWILAGKMPCPQRLDYWNTRLHSIVLSLYWLFQQENFWRWILKYCGVARRFNANFIKSVDLSYWWSERVLLVGRLGTKRLGPGTWRVLGVCKWSEEEIKSKNIIGWWKDQHTRWKSLQNVVLHFATHYLKFCSRKMFSMLSWGFKKGDQHLQDYVETSVGIQLLSLRGWRKSITTK